jgi:tetratricopeptide (TPR) repeat protein
MGVLTMSRASSDVAVSIARLPSTVGALFGRDEDLAWLDACWQEGVRVASIVASGGVGKSALVSAWLARVGADGWRGAERVYGWSFHGQGTDRLSSSDEFVDAALRWFGDPDPKRGSAWDKGERLAALVRKERTILVLDGVEPLQWGPGVQPGKLNDPALQTLVKGLAAQNKGLCLITTRITVADLEGLGGDEVRVKDLSHLSPETGAALLRARGAKGTEGALREVSRVFGGHGLALTLLGSCLEDVAGGDVRRRLELGPLERPEWQGAQARRVIRAHEARLGEPEVAILRIVGLFDRPAEEDEIAALLEAPPVPGLTDALAGVTGLAWSQMISKLRRAGLLAPEPDERVDAHPLVREHFGEQLRRERPASWREGHRRLYEHLRRKAKDRPETVEEMAPLYAAVVHGCLAGRHREAFEEVYRRRIQGWWFDRGALGSEIAALSAFFDPPWAKLAPELSDCEPQVIVMSAAQSALAALGRMAEVATLLETAVGRNVTQRRREEAAADAATLNMLYQALGDLRKAVAHGPEHLELAEESRVHPWRLDAVMSQAAALLAMGQPEKAAAEFERAEWIQRMCGRSPLLTFGFDRCDFLLEQGRDAEVLERATQMLGRVTSDESCLATGLAHLCLGRAHLGANHRGAGGGLALATSHLERAVSCLRLEDTPHLYMYLPLGLLARAALHLHTRALPEARRDLDEAFTLATRRGFRLHEADAHLGYARLALAEADPAAARRHLAAARAIIDATGYHRRDGEVAALSAALRS